MQPRVPTCAFPHPFAPPPRRPLPGWANRLHHGAIDQVMWQCVRPIVNEARREVLSLPSWPFLGPSAQLRGDGRLWLLPFSRHLLPRPADWAPEIAVTGYWFLDRPGWEPPVRSGRFHSRRATARLYRVRQHDPFGPRGDGGAGALRD